MDVRLVREELLKIAQSLDLINKGALQKAKVSNHVSVKKTFRGLQIDIAPNPDLCATLECLIVYLEQQLKEGKKNEP